MKNILGCVCCLFSFISLLIFLYLFFYHRSWKIKKHNCNINRICEKVNDTKGFLFMSEEDKKREIKRILKELEWDEVKIDFKKINKNAKKITRDMYKCLVWEWGGCYLGELSEKDKDFIDKLIEMAKEKKITNIEAVERLLEHIRGERKIKCSSNRSLKLIIFLILTIILFLVGLFCFFK